MEKSFLSVSLLVVSISLVTLFVCSTIIGDKLPDASGLAINKVEKSEVVNPFGVVKAIVK